MASKREKSTPRKMREIFLVICEGKTEENYVNLLSLWYKSPIKIISRVEGTKISPLLVEKQLNELKISRQDNKVQAFIMYDMDVPAINDKLLRCKAGLLLSNPCFELWLLLHSKDQRSAISSDQVIQELKGSASVWNSYEKPNFTDKQKTFLKENTAAAVERAISLEEYGNPSTGVYKLLQKLAGEHRQ